MIFEFGHSNKIKESLGKINEYSLNENKKELQFITSSHIILIKSNYINIGDLKDVENYIDKEILCIEAANFVPINPKKLDSALKDDPIFIYGEDREIQLPYTILTLHLSNGKRASIYGKGKCNLNIKEIKEE